MADEFVQQIKFKVDDSEVKRSLADIEKRAGNIHIKFKVDGSAARIFSQLNNMKNGNVSGSTGGLSSLVREQRHAARSANALAVALDSARRSLEVFALRLTRAGAGRMGTAVAAAPVAGAVINTSNVPFGKLGGFAMALPGLTQMARMVYQPLKSFANGSVNLFNTQNRAEKLLEFGMQRNGTSDRFQELRDYASGIQRRTIYGDEAMLTAAGGWQNRIKSVENSKRMMDLVADYAAKSTGGGAVSADQMRGFSQQLMQALSGRAISLKAQGYDISAIEQLQEFKRKGGTVTEDMEVAALEKVLASVKGAAEELAKTDEGKIIQTQNAMGDLREEVGRRLQPVFARVASAIMSNMPTISRMFESFGNVVERFVQVIVDNSSSIATFAEKAVGMLEILSEFPAAFASFAVAAKVASTAIGVGGAEGGLLSSLGGLGGGLSKLAMSTAWGVLVSELALLGTALWDAYKEARAARENNKKIRENGNIKKSVAGSYKRYKAGEISEEKYKEVYDRAKSLGADLSGSMYDIWQKPSASGAVGSNASAEWEKIVAAMKNSKSVTNNNVTVNNDIKTDSDMTAKIIKDMLRTFTTSQLNFSSRTAVAKAMAT